MKLNQLIVLAALTSVAAAGPAPPEGGAAGKIPDWLDLDGDGVISEEERQAFSESRRQASGGLYFTWDTDGDGVVSEEERQAGVDALRGRVENRRCELFLAAAGEDEVLDRDEFGALHPVSNLPVAVADRLFDLMDADGDGVVTKDEFLAAIDAPDIPDTPGGPPDDVPPTPDTP